MNRAAEQATLPDVPSIKLADVVVEADTLGLIFKAHLGSPITERLIASWAKEVAWVLDCEWAGSIYDTLLQYRGKVVDIKLATVMSLQLAARQNLLHKGFLQAFDTLVRPEWVAVEVVGASETTWEGKNGASCGAELQMVILTGTPAGFTMRRKFPMRWLNGFAYKLGFSKRTVFDQDVRHFIRFRFWGYLVPQEGIELVFEETAVPNREAKYNKGIIKLRTRFEYERAECPKGHTHQCWDCTEPRRECSASIVKPQSK